MKNLASSLYMSFCLMLAAFAVCACNGNGDTHRVLNTASSIMNTNPDSALYLLYSLGADSGNLSKSDLMRWRLLTLSAQNKCNTVFHSDSLQLLLTNYYDRHGNSNERMMAHYLLGRAYSDMGDAPRALRSYQNAVECADTTSEDCDLYNLCSVYGQMAAVFDAQHLYLEEVAAFERFSHFSLKDSDIYNHIKGIELQIPPYCALDDTVHCLELTDRCYNLYMQYGLDKEAASVYPTAIFIHIQNGQYEKAKVLMDIFRYKSGLFDQDGNIVAGREHYYNSCGLYYLGVSRTDSAEYYFRKLLKYHINRDYEAYRGLARVYLAKGQNDSIVKYGILGEAALDSIHADDQAEAVAITNSMYNYNSYERLAIQKELETERIRKWVFALLAFAIILTIYGYRRFSSFKKAKYAEFSRINTKYLAAERRRREVQDDLQMLKNDFDNVLSRKQVEISTLTSEIEGYKLHFKKLRGDEKVSALLQCDTVSSFREMSSAKRGVSSPTEKDWHDLEELFSQYLPSFHSKIIHDDTISTQEARVCMLTRLGFSSGRIALLLGASSQRVTNAKSIANCKLFGTPNASTLYENLKKL